MTDQPRGTIVLVDDHQLFMHSMRLALSAEGFAAEGVDPLGPVGQEVAELDPDIVLLDLALGEGRWGLALLPDIQATCRRVLALTGETEPAVFGDAIIAGCLGVLQKTSPIRDIVSAVELAMQDAPLPQRFADPAWTAAARERHRAHEEEWADFGRLTAREEQVLAALMTGSDVAAIAERSVVSEATVRTQVRGVLTKLGVTSQVQAVARAARIGWRPLQSRRPAGS